MMMDKRNTCEEKPWGEWVGLWGENPHIFVLKTGARRGRSVFKEFARPACLSIMHFVIV